MKRTTTEITRRTAGLLLAIALLSATSAAFAQSRRGAGDDVASDRIQIDIPPADEAVAEEGEVAERSLFGMLRSGGLMMIPIVACSFILTMFVFERFISLRRGRVLPAPFVKKFLHQLREGKLDKEEALEMCREAPSPIADVFAGAVKRWGRPTVEVEQAVLDAEERAAVGLRSYLRLFNAVANVSPLFGLLGTVFGMIRLFGEIGKADAMGRTELLAGGISEALMATAGGLCVAIPALCFYVFFSSRVERLTSDLDSLGQEVVGLISAEAIAESKSGRRRNNSSSAAAA